MIQFLIPLITAALSKSQNEGAKKAAGLINSAASFIKK